MTDQVVTAAAPVAADGTGTPAPAAPLTDLHIGEPDPAPKAEETPKADASVEVVYNPTGDVGLDMALGFVGKLGFTPEDPAMVAATNGDFGMLKAKLAALGAKAQGWEQYVALAEKAHVDTSSKAKAKLEADTKRIHEAVGGAENWTAISKWAGENAEPEEKAAVNAALKQGGLTAKVMAEWLASKYSKASGTTVEPAEAMRPGAAGKADTSGGPLTARAYQTALDALTSKVGMSKVESHPDYRTLNARRMAGQRAGI